MAQNDPWAAFRVGSAPQTPQPMQAPADPIVRRADPYKAEDQQFQRNAESRAQQDQAVQMQRLQLERERDARQKTQDQQGTESERTAGYLTGRMKDAIGRLAGAAKKERDALAPTLGVEATRKVFGDTPANYITSDERQVVRAAQYDILDAALTLGTGAAYTKEQIEGYREAYFPKLGDGEDAKRSKNEALRQLLVNARVKAGRAAPDVDAAIAALDAIDAPEGMIDQQVKAADGSMITFKVKQGATEDEIRAASLEALKQYDPANKYDASVSDATKQQVGAPGGFWSGIGAGVGDLVEGGLNNTVGLLSNPVSSVIGRSMGYEGYTGDIGQTVRDALQLPEGNQTVAAINQAAAGGFGGAGLARGIGGMVGSNALMQYGANPLLDTITGASAAASGETAKQLGAGPGGQAFATLAGGFVPAGMAGARNLVRGGRPPSGPAPDMNVVQAGERQGVPIRQPDARPEMRGDFANLQTSQYAGPAINQARQADNAIIEQKVQEVGGQGNASDPYALGQRVQAAGTRYIANTRAQANRLYKRVEELSQGKTVTAKNADAVLDSNIKELRAAGENSNAAAIKYLEGVRSDIDRGLSVQSVQNLRTNMRGQLSERGLTGTDTDRRLGQVIDAMNTDLADQLPAEASAALKAADSFYRQRQEFVNGTLKQFMGDRGNPLPAETAAARLVSIAQGKGNFERFSKMWGQLDDGERADVSATIAASLGRKVNGEFSPATLIKSLDPRQGINPRTAKLIFGEEGAAALNDLRVIAQAKTDTANALNGSKTGVMVNRSASGLRTLILGGLGFSASGPIGAVAAPAAEGLLAKIGQERAARLMLNPDFTKWLRAMPEATNPKAINAYFGKLKASGAKSQIAANDIDGFTNAVLESFSKSPGRAAAQEEDNGRVKPPQQ